MGCKNTKSVSKPIQIEVKSAILLTPAIIRRNLKTEILFNKNKIREISESITIKKAEYYTMNKSKANEKKIREILEEIQNLESKKFIKETHNMILDLHLDTAAPGCYPNQKFYKKFRSRNGGMSKCSTLTSTRLYSETNRSANLKEITNLTCTDFNRLRSNPLDEGKTEGRWLYFGRLESIADEEPEIAFES
ncbi:unnamed protein product [Moneuplotes crassus]|uniref:Uncharacterized protein n=1 Tax=Euplotes crassus TaxID=5936 RepID=A0AAD1ULD2_EUPCR|nr:unnamed protein product [Moneuplotes crassus]